MADLTNHSASPCVSAANSVSSILTKDFVPQPTVQPCACSHSEFCGSRFLSRSLFPCTAEHLPNRQGERAARIDAETTRERQVSCASSFRLFSDKTQPRISDGPTGLSSAFSSLHDNTVRNRDEVISNASKDHSLHSHIGRVSIRCPWATCANANMRGLGRIYSCQ